MADRVGFTLVETVLVLSVVAFGLLVLFAGMRSSGRFASAYAASIRTVRAEAAATGRSIAVSLGACASAQVVVEPHGLPATVARFPSRGLLFTPDGLPRTCDGGGVGNTTILLEHRGRQAAVIVSALGRVRWELR